MGLSPEMELFVREARVARLATVDEAGQPLVVPICFVWDGTALYSAVDQKPKRSRDLQRLRNIAANPKVSVVIDHYDEAWDRLRWVVFQGQGQLLQTTVEAHEAIDLLRTKYPQYVLMPLSPDAPVIKVTPVRVLSWSASS